MAVVLGVRCWKDRVALVALDGEPGGEPMVVLHRRGKLPGGGSDVDRVEWVHKTVMEAIEESKATLVAVRVSDADPEQHRAEHEGVALLAAAGAQGCQGVALRRQSMLKPLKVPAGVGAWKEFPKSDPFISTFVLDEREAAMAARAALNRGTAS
jgi:hypothetical protein